MTHEYEEFSTAYCGLPQVIRPNRLYDSQMRFGMYRWHITDPIYFKKDIKLTMQALGWRSGHRYLPLQDDIASSPIGIRMSRQNPYRRLVRGMIWKSFKRYLA